MPHGKKFERLLEAGIITTADLDPPYKQVVHGLTPDEIETLIAVKARLIAADEAAGIEPPALGEMPHAMGIIQF
jgi:hypothetical protein